MELVFLVKSIILFLKLTAAGEAVGLQEAVARPNKSLG